jgi:DnaJ domain/PilZ domain
MQTTAKTHRRRVDRKPAGNFSICLEMKNAMNQRRCVYGGLVDVIDGGIGLELPTRVESGAIVVVGGKLGQDRTADQLKAVVRWCTEKTDGTFRAGLEFLVAPKPTNPAKTDTLDCYRTMQLNPDADSATVSRAYRLLALRYHPDNLETGNSETFLRISEAYQILSDPQKRASYDLRRRDAQRPSRTVFTRASPRAASHVTHSRPAVGTLNGWGAALRSV